MSPHPADHKRKRKRNKPPKNGESGDRMRRVRHKIRRRIPPISVMPTLVTLANLIAGFAAIARILVGAIDTPLLREDWSSAIAALADRRIRPQMNRKASVA